MAYLSPVWRLRHSVLLRGRQVAVREIPANESFANAWWQHFDFRHGPKSLRSADEAYFVYVPLPEKAAARNSKVALDSVRPAWIKRVYADSQNGNCFQCSQIFCCGLFP